MKNSARTLIYGALISLSVLPLAGKAAEAPQVVVQKTADRLIEVLRTQALTEGQQQIKRIVDEVLSPVIDFRRIAYRSMGRHYKKATTQQFLAFTEAVKISLINTYSRPLLENNAQELTKKVTVEVRETKSIEGKRPRALVATWLKVGTTEKYDVVYFMYLNAKKDAWLVENLSVEGIDLGINFRNQYQRLISEHQGNIDRVTQIWLKSKVEG